MEVHEHNTEKRIAILEATLELVAEQGFHKTPTSQIAKRAKVGVGSIYRYFTDKDDLFHELFLYVMEQENRAMLQAYNPSAPLREQFIHFGTTFIQFSLQHPKEMNFLQQFRHSPYGKTLGPAEMLKKDPEQTRKPLLFRLFEAGIAQQEIKDLPPPILGALTFGPLLELARDMNSGLIPNDGLFVQLVVESCWDALKREV